MFDRFTDEARQAVVHAQAHARRLGHDYIGTEHVLMGVADAPDSLAGRALIELEVDLGQLHDRAVALASPEGAATDAEALESLGIDLDAVRRKVEDAFGPGALERAAGRRRRGLLRRSRLVPGHIPFTKAARAALELALREALRLNHRWIGSEHVLLGILRQGSGAGARALRVVGVTHGEIEAKILDLLREAS